MDKINSSSYLTDFEVTDLIARSASSWYEIEYKQLSATATTPIKQETLDWHFAQGWGRDETKAADGWDTRNTSGVGTVYLQRTILNAELALNELIADLVSAYNTGRTINDTRYDDILSLYQASLDKTEDELNVHETREDAVYTAVATYIDSYIDTFTTHETEAELAYDAWGTAEENRINDHWDSYIAQKKQERIDHGWYNSTRWTAEETQMEAERTKQLTELAQKQIELQDGLRHRLYRLKTEAYDRLADARTRLDDMLAGHRNARVAMRNRVIEAINRFAERRTDSYPELTEVNKIVKELGSAKPAGSKTP